MPMGMNIGSAYWGGGIDSVLLRQLREFEAKPRQERFAKVYRWVIVNSLLSLGILLVGCFIIYFLTHMKELAGVPNK